MFEKIFIVVLNNVFLSECQKFMAESEGLKGSKNALYLRGNGSKSALIQEK